MTITNFPIAINIYALGIDFVQRWHASSIGASADFWTLVGSSHRWLELEVVTLS